MATDAEINYDEGHDEGVVRHFYCGHCTMIETVTCYTATIIHHHGIWAYPLLPIRKKDIGARLRKDHLGTLEVLTPIK
jgi:hypothetical protein